MPSCNIMLLGNQKKTLSGFSSAAVNPHTGRSLLFKFVFCSFVSNFRFVIYCQVNKIIFKLFCETLTVNVCYSFPYFGCKNLAIILICRLYFPQRDCTTNARRYEEKSCSIGFSKGKSDLF